MTNNALLIIDVQKGFINEYTRELPGKIEASKQLCQRLCYAIY